MCGAARRADRRHAHRVLADAAQRQAERRIDQPPRHQEEHEQHDQRVPVGGVAVEIEPEQAEQRPHPHALQAVGAAGEPARAVGGLEQQEPEAERDHDQRQMAEARDDEAHQHSRAGPRQCPRSSKPGERLAPAALGDEARGVGAEAEERGVAERDDAGVAEDQIERQREQRGDRDLARQHQIVRRHHERQQRREPEHDLDGAPADLRFQMLVRAGDRGGGDCHTRLPNRPAGRHISRLTITR